MVVLLLAHVNRVPLTAPVKVTAVVWVPLQSVWLAGAATVGVGLTVMLNDDGVPAQPAATGVTVIVVLTVCFIAITSEIYRLSH